MIKRDLLFERDGELIYGKIDELLVISKLMGYNVTITDYKQLNHFFEYYRNIVIQNMDMIFEIEIDFNVKLSNTVSSVRIYFGNYVDDGGLCYNGLDCDEIAKALDKITQKL